MWKFIDLSLIEQFILQTLGKRLHLHIVPDQALCPFVSVGFSLNQSCTRRLLSCSMKKADTRLLGQYVAGTLG